MKKGLQLIEAFDDAHPRMTSSQAGERCGMTRTAARRYLLTLTHLGNVAMDGKLFWLTPRMLRLGQSYLDSTRLPRIVQPFLQRVAAGTSEVAYVCVLDGEEIVYIARNGLNRNMNTGHVLGVRVQAQVTAAGMVLLSMMDPNRQDQWFANRKLKAYTSFTNTDCDHAYFTRSHGSSCQACAACAARNGTQLAKFNLTWMDLSTPASNLRNLYPVNPHSSQTL